MKKVNLSIASALVITIVGCAGTTGVVKLEKNKYMVSDKNPKVGFVNAAEEEASVYKQANVFCAKQNKEVKTIKLDSIGSGALQQASATLTFTCIK